MPGPGGRAAVDEQRVNANWNEYASLALLITRLTRAGPAGLRTRRPGRTTARFRDNSNLSFPGD